MQHPLCREYSFYLHVHKSYSRIDYFLTSNNNLISQIVNSKYHNILISDHSPLAKTLALSFPRQAYAWRLNASLLDDNFVKNKTSKLRGYIEINDNGEVSDSILWETLVLRGDIISYTSALNKDRKKRLYEIVFSPAWKRSIKSLNTVV